ARPGAYWPWLNGNVDLAQITRELEEMKAKGMSGAEIWDVGVIHPHPDAPVAAGPAFLGPESLAAIHHAINEATRLGLHLGLVASSSWNAGGSWVEPRDAMKALFASETAVTGPATIARKLPFPSNKAPKGASGLPIYYQEIAVLAFPRTEQNVIPDAAAVINLSGRMNAEGVLTWDVPPGEWVVMRFVCTNTGQKLRVPSPNSDGLLIDHLDARAAAHHFSHILRQILKGRKRLDALKYMELDSVEILPGTDWTEGFVAEFRRHRRYDPTPYLPVLAGKKFADPQVAERFSHDYRATVSDLWIEGHYRASREALNQHGLRLVAEAGHGGEPRAEPLRALGVSGVPRGEFWNGSPYWVVKEAASAAHIYGLKYVDAESFTGWRHWQDGPLEYKRLADTAFCAGLNRITIHTFAHSPPAAGLPGLVYHAGEHLNVNTTWWPKAAPLFAYLSRCCYLLQRGRPVADVCYYYGDDAPNLVATRRIGPHPQRLDGKTCAHCGRPNPAPADALGAGYDYDVVNSDVILTRMRVKDGRLTLPDGVSYAVLVLPDRPDMPLAVLERIEKFVHEGATVLGPKPVRSPTLADYPRCDERVLSLADRLWGSCDGKQVFERAYGKGWVVWDRARAREILRQRGIGPDFTFSSADKGVDLDYLHRRTCDADIYFISNKHPRDAEAECVFRVMGRQPHFWFPDTGEIQRCVAYDIRAGGTRLPLRLPPAGSLFVVLSGRPEVARATERHTAVAPALPAPRTSLQARQAGAAPLEIVGPWEVRFPRNLGAPPSWMLDKLVSWANVPDEGVMYFSGTATYFKDFDVPAEALIQGRRAFLDLGQVRNVAGVTLNGRPLGILWKPPFQVDVTGVLLSGRNQLEIELTNLWANRLVGDARLPEEQRLTRMAQRLPVQGPLESGLLGPVLLRFEARLGPL
ncbi:MAG: hypothetical protein HY674_08825, partial [Chloroflexi bacterium]|nr:hypothetical protein [Chloroflexota bacterium]